MVGGGVAREGRAAVKTVHSIQVGRRLVVLRSDGQVYIGEPDEGIGGYAFMRDAQAVASSAAGCSALADALQEMANFIREKGPL
jgi:hypothetical protein